MTSPTSSPDRDSCHQHLRPKGSFAAHGGQCQLSSIEHQRFILPSFTSLHKSMFVQHSELYNNTIASRAKTLNASVQKRSLGFKRNRHQSSLRIVVKTDKYQGEREEINAYWLDSLLNLSSLNAEA